jgi:hypothetical protein
MQQQIATVKAVRLENFAYNDWLASLHQRLLSRYPGGQFLYQTPSVVLVLLNTTKPWGKDDEEFFASLRTQAFFQRWEPLGEVPPTPKANSTVYEDIGYRIGSGMRLTTRQQEALFSQLNDLELRATTAVREANEQRNRADSLTEYNHQLVEQHNHLVGILEGINRALQINVIGDYKEGCTVEDSATGQILLRDTPLDEIYRAVLQLRQGLGKDGSDAERK